MLFRGNLQTNVQLFGKLADDVQSHTGALSVVPTRAAGEAPLCYTGKLMGRDARAVVRKAQKVLLQGNLDLAAQTVFGAVDKQLFEDKHQQLGIGIDAGAPIHADANVRRNQKLHLLPDGLVADFT